MGDPDPVIGRIKEIIESGANDITVYGLISPHVAAAIEESFSREFPSFMFRREPLPPPTFRQRMTARRRRVAGYFRHLGLALVDRCDRERDYWD